jgi:hypothetical protein
VENIVTPATKSEYVPVVSVDRLGTYYFGILVFLCVANLFLSFRLQDIQDRLSRIDHAITASAKQVPSGGAK